MTPHVQSFDWRVWAGSAIQFRRTGFEPDTVPWLSFGQVEDVLHASHEPEDGLAFRHFHSGWVFDPQGMWSDKGQAERERKRRKDLDRSHQLVSELSAIVGLRLDPQRGWRMLSQNAVLHWSMGPAFTVATNGEEVILFSEPTLRAESWTMTHRRSVIGPVTSRQLAVKDWDYLENKATASFAGKGQKPAKQKSARQLLLESI